MMAALRSLTLVPAQILKHGFLGPFVRKAQANKFSSVARKCQSTFGTFSFGKQFPVQCYSSAKSSTDAKGLAEEILKSRVPQPDSGGQQQKGKSNESQEESEEERKKREAAWRTIKWTFLAFGVSFTSLGIWVLTECGKTLIKSPRAYGLLRNSSWFRCS
jgi:hypothetical protein